MSEKKKSGKTKTKNTKKSKKEKSEVKKGSVSSAVRFQIEPRRFQRMLENLLTYRKNYALDAVGGVFTPSGAIFADMQLEVSGYAAVFDKSFFIKYDCPNTTLVPFSKSVAHVMKSYFINIDEVEVTIQGDQILIRGGEESYNEDLTDVSELVRPLPFKAMANKSDLFSIKLEEVSKIVDFNISSLQNEDKVDTIFADKEEKEASYLKDKSIIPKKSSFDIMVSVDVSEIGFKDADLYKIICEAKSESISVIVEGIGKYTKSLAVKRTEKLSDYEATFSGDSWLDAAIQFDGEVWLSFQKKAVVIHQKTKDRSMSYFVSSN